ncbi:MAG: 3'-5' exonuclease [Candidatus Omnitrophica bacterium]|nr:3'-5' exonuclease [Candidatus Omnitrophota bacterium]
MLKALDMEYVIFDVETTGLSPLEGDRIIEIAAIRVRHGKNIETFTSLVNPGRALNAEAMRLNNITEAMIKDAPTAADVLPQMADFVGGACLVAHNASFDIKFLCHELSLMGRKLRAETPVLDTMKMSKAFLPYLASHRLSSLAQSLGVSVGMTHRALADVEILCEVFKRLLSMAGDYNIHQLPEMVTQFGVEKPTFRLANILQSSLF